MTACHSRSVPVDRPLRAAQLASTSWLTPVDSATMLRSCCSSAGYSVSQKNVSSELTWATSTPARASTSG